MSNLKKVIKKENKNLLESVSNEEEGTDHEEQDKEYSDEEYSDEEYSDEEYSDEESDNKFDGNTIICIKDGNIFKKIMDLLKEVLDIGIFIINEDGISLESLDSSHVSFIQMLLKKEDFHKFIINKKREEDLHFAVSMKSLCNILKCLNNGEQITISHEDGSNKITWIFQNLDTNTYQKFNLNLIEHETHDINIPKSDYHCRIKTMSSVLQNILKNLAYIGDYLCINVNKEENHIDFKSSGIDSDALIRMTKNEYTKLKLTKNITSSYSIDYLTKYAKSSAFSSKVSIFLKTDAPILLEYKIDNLSGMIKFYIAPKSIV